MNQNLKYALIAGGVVVALYAVNRGAEAVANGIGTGAELTGGGLGIALIAGAVLFFA
jgi:hypothetical protein